MTLEMKMGRSTRDAYGDALVEIGKSNPNVVVLDADLATSTRTAKFAKTFPDRFFNCGIAEANMVGIAGGLAACGKIPFVSSFACFLMCKGYDQMRMCVAFPEANVKIVPSHGGIVTGEDGVSQQSVEDVALAASLPGVTVIVPSDEISAGALIKEAAETPGPFYIRTGRPKSPVLYGTDQKFKVGKAIQLRKGKDISILAMGCIVAEAMIAAAQLEKEGISAAVWDHHTVKPIDREAVCTAVRETGALVSAEEHQIWGGLGSTISRIVAEECPAPMGFVAIQDTYATSGTAEELLDKYGLSAPHIVKCVKETLRKKKK